MQRKGGLACVLVLAGAGLAMGQEQETRTNTQVRKASILIGSSVRLQEDVEYGKIEDIVFNDMGCVEYVVIASDERYVLVPWAVTTVNLEERFVTIDVTREKLQSLAFTKDHWPGLSDPKFTQKVQQVFGSKDTRREGRTEGKQRSGSPGERSQKKGLTPKGSAPSGRQDIPGGREAAPKSEDQPRAGEAQPKAEDRPKNEQPQPKKGTQPKAGQPAEPKAEATRPRS